MRSSLTGFYSEQVGPSTATLAGTPQVTQLAKWSAGGYDVVARPADHSKRVDGRINDLGPAQPQFIDMMNFQRGHASRAKSFDEIEATYAAAALRALKSSHL